MKRFLSVFIACSVLSITACTEKDNNGKKLSTPVSGELSVSVDETFQSIMEAQEDVFESIYSKAAITTHYKPETDVMQDFLNDSVSLVVVCRDLNDQEKAYFKEIKI